LGGLDGAVAPAKGDRRGKAGGYICRDCRIETWFATGLNNQNCAPILLITHENIASQYHFYNIRRNNGCALVRL
jgi:hypothetical protein